MKRILTSILLAASLLTFNSCDKIDEGQYTRFAGAAGTWYETQVEIPHVQRAFIEKYTGVRCINCPKADEIIHAATDKYGDSVVVVAVHSRSTGFGRPLGDDPSLCTESGDEWYDYFGIITQPAAIINRTQSNNSWDIFTPTSNFDDRIDAIVNQTPPIAIAIENGHEKDTHYTDIYIEFIQQQPGNLTLTLLLTEDKIYTRQSQQGVGEIENYEQNHVLRTIVTNLWGLDIPHELSQHPGKAMILIHYQLPESCKAENCHAVAFVSHRDTRRIINCAQTNLQ